MEKNGNSIAVIVLTMNEEINIKECLSSALLFSREIYVVDSGSSDKTVDIAKEMGAKVFVHPFINYATQFNWALDNLNIEAKWILRLDADERITKDLGDEMLEATAKHSDDDVNGFVLKLRTFFMGKELKHGGVYPFKKLMLFKKGIGRIEERKMDEHTTLSCGKSLELRCDGIHYDYKDLTYFIKKHNWYSTREAQDVLEGTVSVGTENLEKGQIKRRRKSKNFYYKLPSFFRCFLLFVYYYIFRLGFLDGKLGLIHCFLSVYWYRFLVDAKIYEYKVTKKAFEETGSLK